MKKRHYPRKVRAMVAIAAAVGFWATGSVEAQVETALMASDGSGADYFGHSVALSGTTAVVGAKQDDDRGTDSGSVYIFERGTSSWTQSKLTAYDGAPADLFGTSVAIAGDVLVVGSPNDDDRGGNSGSVYVYRRSGTTWVFERKLTAADGAASEQFGSAVAVSRDTATANTYSLIVGAYNDGVSTYSYGNGAAYVFRFNGTSWYEEKKLVAPDGAPLDRFGGAVGISGNVAIVAAYYDDDNGINSGSAYVFRRSGSTWSTGVKLPRTDAVGYDYFGFSVAISGTLAAVGCYQDDDRGLNFGSVYIYRDNGSTWYKEAELYGVDSASNDRYGFAVWAMPADRVLVGAPNAGRTDAGSLDGEGAAYLYQKAGSSWNLDVKLMASTGNAADAFGYSVGGSEDLVVVGANWFGTQVVTGAAFVYSLAGASGCTSNSDCADDGNFCTSEVCSNGTCTHPNKSAGTACGSSGSTACDAPDTCDGAGHCVDRVDPVGTVCRAAAGECDLADTCNGISKTCTDVKKPAGTVCTSDLNTCTTDSCNGTSNYCQHTPVIDGTLCNDGDSTTVNDHCTAGVCDGDANAPSCDYSNPCRVVTIVNNNCVYSNAPNGTACTADTNDCTYDVCNNGYCTHPYKPVGAACGNSSSFECDAPDSCNGTGWCIDRIDPSLTVCRAANGECDLQDTCDGLSKSCPDRKKSAGTACTADTNSCTLDQCNGTSSLCQHPYKSAGSPCGSSSASLCDDPDTCNSSGVCLANNLPDGTECDVSGACEGGECVDQAPICGGRGAFCDQHADCCSNNCNFNSRRCK